MSEHTYDWVIRLDETAQKCYHLAVAQCEPQRGVDGRIAEILGKCLKCNSAIAIMGSYLKTDRECGGRPVYIRRL